RLRQRRLPVLLGVDRLQERRRLAHLPGRHRREGVAVEVDRAPLPARLREALAQGLHQPQALGRDHQPPALQAPLLQVAQEGAPALGVLLGPFHDAQDLAEAVGVDADGHQHRHRADLAAELAAQPDAVQVDVGVLPGQRAVAPGVDAGVDLLVQLADGARADARAPQRRGDVLDAADRHPGQVHLHQRLPRGARAAGVALDGRALEGGPPQLGDLQLDLPGLGLQGAGVGAGAVVGAVGGALVALGVAQGVGLGVEQRVQGLLHGVADQAIDVLPELALVDLDQLHPVAWFVSYTTHGSPLGVWPQLKPVHATVGRPRGCRFKMCETYCTSSTGPASSWYPGTRTLSRPPVVDPVPGDHSTAKRAGYMRVSR